MRFRRGELAMIAGEPGAGKSLLALWLAIRWTGDHGLKGIYFSADSAERGQGARALAMLDHYGLTVDEADQMIERRDDRIADLMAKLDGLMWSFENDLNYESIGEEVDAFVELWGEAPDFIFVDNLTDVDGQAEDEFGHMRRVMKGLTQLARTTGAAVVVLHHTSESERIRKDPCPPKWAIQGKVDQKPSLVITVADRGRERPACPVKNRYGKPSPAGTEAVMLGWNPNTFHFSERAA